MSWKVHLHDDYATDNLQIFISQHNLMTNERISIVGTPCPPLGGDGGTIKPFLELNSLDAADLIQSFVDAAWDAGYKPRKLEDHNNELVATRKHLDDFRRIVSKQIDTLFYYGDNAV